MQLFFLLFFDIFNILQFLLQLINGQIFTSNLVVKHVESVLLGFYLSMDSVDISLALRSLRMFLYISICLYAFVNYFFYFYKFLWGLSMRYIDLPTFSFCLFIFLVNYSFCLFRV